MFSGCHRSQPAFKHNICRYNDMRMLFLFQNFDDTVPKALKHEVLQTVASFL